MRTVMLSKRMRFQLRCPHGLQENATAAPELLIMLLCNVTTTEQGSKQMLQVGRGDLEGFHM